MAAKKKATVKQLTTWLVISNGQEVEVEAVEVEVTDGCLIFTDAGVVQAFSDGGWTAMKRLEEETP